ncbi:ester cyclase [Halalkalicoccus sp. GCM10025322]|uniref:ester cyclase n=2 Tax=Halococcaceae TaxID=1963270 RepID=UPI002F969DD9
MSTTINMHPAIARATKAFNDHDLDEYISAFADDATFTDPIHKGLEKAETREYMAGVVEAFPDVYVEPERIISSGNETAIEWSFHGTQEGEFNGIPPTGETVDAPLVSIITVSDDGITSWTDYWDQMELAEQLGLE